MQIWRMNPDGSDQNANHFRRFQQLVRASVAGWQMDRVPVRMRQDVKGHPANQDVQLRLMSLADGKIQVLAKLFGGQGTMNVPSWSPDSKNVAFVSYQLVYP